MLSSPTQFFEKKEAVKQGDFCVTLALKILIYAK